MTILSSSVFQEQETRGSNVSDSSDPRIQKMMESIIQEPRAFFKNQSRDEDDLTLDEKEGIARRLLVEKPDVFLTRYSLLSPPIACLFSKTAPAPITRTMSLKESLKN
ncbi:unnamed protein product [Lepeophtheirus salmonis]|uniref:(salmon louse) hypothetical protein n=1 Tax=Lepeophtheirus salmonis TaxID=72036 RepID=A0A7R8CMV6_LEPSM|nr:unnamed protein product [Lepeophtheirus salmonis]CAF2868802.1 unnamed protein product [Lepeophtheirus salmonis]